MFTGIVEEIGRIKKIEKRRDFFNMEIFAEKILKNIKKGESVAVNGVCVTITEVKGNCFSVNLMKETVQKTNLGKIKVNEKVNLETPVSFEKFLSGHLVQGHIDGKGKIIEIKGDVLKISFPENLKRYFVVKGSVCIDGVSLTIVDVQKNYFTVNLIPYTKQNTTLGNKKVGEEVNIEVDIIAKYLEKFFTKNESLITWDFLRENNYL